MPSKALDHNKIKRVNEAYSHYKHDIMAILTAGNFHLVLQGVLVNVLRRGSLDFKGLISQKNIKYWYDNLKRKNNCMIFYATTLLQEVMSIYIK